MLSLQTCCFVHRAFLELLNEVCFNNRVHHRNKLILVKSRFSTVLVTRVKKKSFLVSNAELVYQYLISNENIAAFQADLVPMIWD